MKIIGINFTTNSNGERVYTIYGSSPFDSYYKNLQAGRNCVGEKTESVYIGTAYNCSELKPGMEIEILYDKAITAKGKTFQPIKRIDVINSNK